MNFRALIVVIACLAGAAFLGWRSFTQTLPKPAELTQVEGTVDRVETVTRKSRRSSATYPVIHIKGKEEGFKYLDWFPNPPRIYDVLPGDQVRLLTDAQGERWIWSLSKAGRDIVTYDEVAGAVRDNRRYDPYIAGGLAIGGLVALFRMLKARRT